MADYFDHLYLMNSVLSLAYNLESYPNHLFNAGYKISRIEPKIKVQGILSPDIFFISDVRGLFAECKTGNRMIGSNLKNYQQISARHLVEKGIDIPSNDLDLDIAIFGYDNINLLNYKLSNEGIDYPQVIINNNIYKKYGRDFKDTELQNQFNEPKEIKGKPLIILKFGEDSPLEKIAPFVFQELMARSISSRATFTTREFTEELIGDIWNSLDSKLQKAMSNKVKSLLSFCKLQREIRPYLIKRDDIWTIKIKDHWKSKKKFSNNCETVMGKLNQCTLINFDVKRDSRNRTRKPE
jgi:hypothetical protein